MPDAQQVPGHYQTLENRRSLGLEVRMTSVGAQCFKHGGLQRPSPKSMIYGWED